MRRGLISCERGRVVRFPKGAEPMMEVFERAANSTPDVARQYDEPGIRHLVALCLELQRATGDGPVLSERSNRRQAA